MNNLVRHLLECNLDQIVGRSLAHCHTTNVHSIMLLECPGKTIRLFIAEPGHKLAGNFPKRFESEQSVGFHGHHCELTLVPVMGSVFNFKVSKFITPNEDFEVIEFAYRSKIKTGKIKFQKLGSIRLFINLCQKMELGQNYYMSGNQLHTIAVPENTWAAWFVFEGREYPLHDGHVFSSQPLDRRGFEMLYKPMSENRIRKLIRIVGLNQ